MTCPPGIAVIIPVHDVVTYLSEALASVSEAFEIIVVDDGSQSSAAVEIERICAGLPNVRHCRQPHGGAARARMRGASLANAEYILFLDADDILLPGALRYLCEALAARPGAVAVYGRVQPVDVHGIALGEAAPALSNMPSGKEALRLLLEKELLLYNGAVCMRRAALLSLPPIGHGVALAEDWLLWCHLALAGDIAPAGEKTVLHYRRHDANTTAGLLADPSPVFAAIDTAFADPAFLKAFNRNELSAMCERCVGRMHAYLARRYAQAHDPVRARFHMQHGSAYLAAKAPLG